MSMVEVDPHFFIKCRLCLEELGTFQIIPAIQEKISYCFDINVEPFDSLPQLICRKCQLNITNVANLKKTYNENQNELKKRSQEHNMTNDKISKKKQLGRPIKIKRGPKPGQKLLKIEQLLVKLDNGSAVKRENTYPIDENKTNKRRKISDSSSAVSECNDESNDQLNNSEETKKQLWTSDYRKTFECRLCNSSWLTHKSLLKHRLKHRNMKSKYADIFNKYCFLKLLKVDNKPNITGSLDQVVYSRSKIIAKGNLDYYIAYKHKGNSNKNSDDEGANNNCTGDESSESSFNRVLVRKRRKRRILSGSSTDTIVLENKSNASDNDNESSKKSQENQCINIDDTDSDDADKINQQKEKRKVNKKNSVSVIKATVVAKLVSTTYNKHLKKQEQQEKPSLEQLNRKITSIGRQIINKRSFNCSRVMKYMEHLNLNIIWLSRSPLNVTSNSNYLKIIPRLRYSNEKNISDYEGYKIKCERGSAEEASLEQKPAIEEEADEAEESGVEESSGVVETPRVVEASGVVETSGDVEGSGIVKSSSLVQASSSVEESGVVESSGSQSFHSGRQYSETVHTASSTVSANEKYKLSFRPELDVAMLYSVNATDTRKILNANPVANPRQLKKFSSDAKKDKAKSPAVIPILEVNPDELSSEVTSGNENNTHMPIISFTRSLAVPEAEFIGVTNESLNNNSTDNNTSRNSVNSNSEFQKPTAPRIKVKSAAELMSKETLNRMKEPSAAVVTQSQQSSLNGSSFSVYGTPQIQNARQLTINNVESMNSPESQSDDYVVLDTVELPNTKTSSPFSYLRTLLQVHNLTLLDTDFTLNADFHTLIRFKVLYKQETKDDPVILCLSLFCSNNSFCLKVKDRNEDNINMSKISANWQWEILKIYRGEVTKKLLSTAQKISQETYELTNRFLCLLKSIKFVSK